MKIGRHRSISSITSLLHIEREWVKGKPPTPFPVGTTSTHGLHLTEAVYFIIDLSVGVSSLVCLSFPLHYTWGHWVAITTVYADQRLNWSGMSK